MQGERLKTMRKQLRLTQAHAAEILGLSTPYVGELERGEKPIDVRLSKRIQDNIWPRIEVSWSKALNGWTVTVTAPMAQGATPGRRHVVVAKYDTKEEAIKRAEAIKETEEPGAKIAVYDNRPPNVTRTSSAS